MKGRGYDAPCLYVDSMLTIYQTQKRPAPLTLQGESPLNFYQRAFLFFDFILFSGVRFVLLPEELLDGDALGQIAWLVNIGTFEDCDVVGQ